MCGGGRAMGRRPRAWKAAILAMLLALPPAIPCNAQEAGTGGGSSLDPATLNRIRQDAEQQASQLANLTPTVRRRVLLQYVLSAFAQAARLPGADVNLLSPGDRRA